MSLCSAAQMCLTPLTTCNSIHATAPHEYPTRRPLQVLWGGELRRRRRTYALHTPIDWRKLVALPATTQAQPRRSRGCESPFSASSPSILARCCCRRAAAQWFQMTETRQKNYLQWFHEFFKSSFSKFTWFPFPVYQSLESSHVGSCHIFGLPKYLNCY